MDMKVLWHPVFLQFDILTDVFCFRTDWNFIFCVVGIHVFHQADELGKGILGLRGTGHYHGIQRV